MAREGGTTVWFGWSEWPQRSAKRGCRVRVGPTLHFLMMAPSEKDYTISLTSTALVSHPHFKNCSTSASRRPPCLLSSWLALSPAVAPRLSPPLLCVFNHPEDFAGKVLSSSSAVTQVTPSTQDDSTLIFNLFAFVPHAILVIHREESLSPALPWKSSEAKVRTVGFQLQQEASEFA